MEITFGDKYIRENMMNFLYMTESEKTEWEVSSSMSVTATSGSP